jgi:hypothetical protein
MAIRTFAAISLSLMILGRIADTLVTYAFTPNLALEANPLASVLGLGWPTLLAVNLLAIAAVAFCTLRWCARPTDYQPSAEVHDLWSFASFACYGQVYRPLTFLRKRLLSPPTQRGHTMQLVGAVMPLTIAVISVVAVLSWHALYGATPSAGYTRFYGSLWPIFPYALAIPAMWLAALLFYRLEFRRYQQQCTDNSCETPAASATTGLVCEMEAAI